MEKAQVDFGKSSVKRLSRGQSNAVPNTCIVYCPASTHGTRDRAAIWSSEHLAEDLDLSIGGLQQRRGDERRARQSRTIRADHKHLTHRIADSIGYPRNADTQ